LYKFCPSTKVFYHFPEHTFGDVHGKVDLYPLDIETGHEADGVPAGREEEQATEVGGVDDRGGQRGVLEGDATYEADIIKLRIYQNNVHLT